MIAESISFVLRNLPAFLLVIALGAAALRRAHWSTPERFLSWLLLLPVGVTCLWAAVFHLFFPAKYGGNIMIEYQCEEQLICDQDQKSFKAYLARWLGVTRAER